MWTPYKTSILSRNSAKKNWSRKIFILESGEIEQKSSGSLSDVDKSHRTPCRQSSIDWRNSLSVRQQCPLGLRPCPYNPCLIPIGGVSVFKLSEFWFNRLTALIDIRIMSMSEILKINRLTDSKNLLKKRDYNLQLTLPWYHLIVVAAMIMHKTETFFIRMNQSQVFLLKPNLYRISICYWISFLFTLSFTEHHWSSFLENMKL